MGFFLFFFFIITKMKKLKKKIINGYKILDITIKLIN